MSLMTRKGNSRIIYGDRHLQSFEVKKKLSFINCTQTMKKYVAQLPFIQSIKSNTPSKLFGNYIDYHYQVTHPLMKNEQAQDNQLLHLIDPLPPQPLLNKESNQLPSSSQPVFSEQFLQAYQELLFQKERVKKQKIIQKLGEGGVQYYPTENYDYFEMKLMKSTQNLQAMTIKCYMGPFSTIIDIYRTNLHNQMHCCECLYGNSGNVYLYDLKGQLFAIKCMQINKHKSSQITFSKFILRAIKQYFFAKIASILKVGPQLIKYQEFDLIFYSNCIQFWMEQCTLIQDQDQRNKYKKQLTRNLRILHEIHIVHCDIKVQNIAYSLCYGKPVFIDFGNSKVLNKGPGYKFATYFFGTLDYSSPEMQKLYLTRGKGLVDLYYNDAHCFSKIFLDGESKSTCTTPIQNIINFNDQSGWFARTKLQYYLYGNDLKKIKKDFIQNCQNWQSVLSFFQSLLPNEDLRDFYHTNCYSEWSQSFKFRKLYQTYKFNKQYHIAIPQQHRLQSEANDWNIHVFKRFMNRKISFEQLDAFMEDQRVRIIKNRADLFEGFKYFQQKITMNSESSILLGFKYFKARKQGENSTSKDYFCYLNDKLQEYSKSEIYIPSLQVFKQIVKKKALIHPSSHLQTLKIIEQFGKFKYQDLIPFLIQCKMLESTFWENKPAVHRRETIQNAMRIVSDNMKGVVDEVVMKFDVSLINFFLFQQDEELEVLSKLFGNMQIGLRRESRNKLLNLAKIKSLVSREQYDEAKQQIFSNCSNLFYFKYLDVGHLYLFKIFHQTHSYNTAQRILQFIDKHIERQIGSSYCKEYFREERTLYAYQNSVNYFNDHFRPNQFVTIQRINSFTHTFLKIMRKENKYCYLGWEQEQRRQKQRANAQNFKSLLAYLQNLQVQKFQREKKLLFYQSKQQQSTSSIQAAALQTTEIEQLRQLKILTNRIMQLRLYYNQVYGDIFDSQTIIYQVAKRRQHLQFPQSFSILDHFLKAIKFCRLGYSRRLQLQLYDKILIYKSAPNVRSFTVNSFTFMFVLKYCFQIKNLKHFKEMLETLMQYVDTNQAKSSINFYVSCLRYIFADQLDESQLVFITNTLSFKGAPWKYSYFAMYRFQVLSKLAPVWTEQQLEIEIVRSVKYIPYLNTHCVRYVQNILYPLLFGLDLPRKHKCLSLDQKQRVRSKMREKLLRNARKNIIYYARLTKQSYRLNQISLYCGSTPNLNQHQTLSSENLLKYYMGKLKDTPQYFKLMKGNSTKIGSLGSRPQMNRLMRQKLKQYHCNCRNGEYKTVRDGQRRQLYRLCLQ